MKIKDYKETCDTCKYLVHLSGMFVRPGTVECIRYPQSVDKTWSRTPCGEYKMNNKWHNYFVNERIKNILKFGW